MNEWELTDEQANQALLDGMDACYGKPRLWTTERANRAIATAAQQKLVGWSEGECKHDSKRIRRCCDLCWRDVKSALGVK